jgi:hypothetical protein
MQEYSSTEVKTLIQSEAENSLESMLREGARRMLQTALEMEVSTSIHIVLVSNNFGSTIRATTAGSCKYNPDKPACSFSYAITERVESLINLAIYLCDH